MLLDPTTLALHIQSDCEGFDRYGNPFPDDEPVVGTRDYDERKDLRDQYRANTLSYGDYMVKLQPIVQGPKSRPRASHDFQWNDQR